MNNFSSELKKAVSKEAILPFIGVYDVFSAGIAGKYYKNIFLSGFSFAASQYGLPDIGFITWRDMTSLTSRVRTILPHHRIIVDVDDGYGDLEIAGHACWSLEQAGASAIVLEDQQRPRRCGHLPGKTILPVESYLEKLHKVLSVRKNMLVIARTDAQGQEALNRVQAYAEAGADMVLADGIYNFASLTAVVNQVPNTPIVFNQINSGASIPATLDELKKLGISVVLFSTPCLFAAQASIDQTMRALQKSGGILNDEVNCGIELKETVALLEDNLKARDTS